MKTRITLAALAVALLAACSEPMAPAAILTPATSQAASSVTATSSGFGMGTGSRSETEEGTSTESVSTTDSAPADTTGRGGFMVGSGS